MTKEIEMTNYRLEIKPAIPSKERHKIEDVLKSMGYDVYGGGTNTDLSSCNISFGGIPSKHLFRMSKIKDV
jgi:hypothetical protein